MEEFNDTNRQRNEVLQARLDRYKFNILIDPKDREDNPIYIISWSFLSGRTLTRGEFKKQEVLLLNYILWVVVEEKQGSGAEGIESWILILCREYADANGQLRMRLGEEHYVYIWILVPISIVGWVVGNSSLRWVDIKRILVRSKGRGLNLGIRPGLGLVLKRLTVVSRAETNK